MTPTNETNTISERKKISSKSRSHIRLFMCPECRKKYKTKELMDKIITVFSYILVFSVIGFNVIYLLQGGNRIEYIIAGIIIGLGSFLFLFLIKYLVGILLHGKEWWNNSKVDFTQTLAGFGNKEYDKEFKLVNGLNDGVSD